jgi:pheromone shutdown protein TraB
MFVVIAVIMVSLVDLQVVHGFVSVVSTKSPLAFNTKANAIANEIMKKQRSKSWAQTTTTTTRISQQCQWQTSSLFFSCSSSSQNANSRQKEEEVEPSSPGTNAASTTISTPTPTTTTSAAITIIDPTTQCEVVLLGCFHGTKSSADDVAQLVTSETDVVVLELCTSRFADLRREQEKQKLQQQQQQQQQQKNPGQQKRLVQKTSWAVRYVQMVSTTISKKGLATGIAAGLLSGVSGLQSAMSGFEPGLEFTTALERGQQLHCDIVLADQDVDETLRKLGSLPIDALRTIGVSGDITSFDSFSRQDDNKSFFEEYLFHLTTLRTAILGYSSTAGADDGDIGRSIPQVQVFPVLLRNEAAIRDLIRLAIPSIINIVLLSQFIASVLGSASNWANVAAISADSTLSDMTYYGTLIGDSDNYEVSLAMHFIASSFILLSGLMSMTPIIKIILTERDAVLTEGILAACQRAGTGGRVVAVLGLLHVNGVANRIMASAKCSDEAQQ